MMAPDSFRSYVCTQRKLRWQYISEKNGILALPEMMKSKDGNWLNVVKYAEEGYCLKKSEFVPASNSKLFVEKELAKIQSLKDEIKKRKCSLFNSQMKIVPWKANELEWLSNLIDEIKPVEDQLQNLSSSITSSILRSQNSVVLSEAKKVEEKRIARRKRENKAKAEKDKAVRLLNSSCSVLNIICRNGEELSQKVEKGDFSIVVMKEDLIEENFAKMIPKLHIRGLRNLKEKGVFPVESLGIIESLIWDLDQELESTKKRNLDVKERKLEKMKDSKKQRTLTNYFK